MARHRLVDRSGRERARVRGHGTPGRRSFFEVIVDNVKEGTEEIGHQAEELGRTVSGFFAGANPLSPSPRTSDSPGRTPKREDV